MKCEECDDGTLVYTGTALYVDPLKYQHKCDNCGSVKNYTQVEIDNVKNKS